MTPVSMTLGDVVPALQQGTIDASITGIGGAVGLHMLDAAKYITEINQPWIFIVVEVNKKWYNSLPKDLQQIVDEDAAKEDLSINPIAVKMRGEQLDQWKRSGGTLIDLPAAEESDMPKILASVGADVSKSNPKLAGAYATVTEAAKRAEHCN